MISCKSQDLRIQKVYGSTIESRFQKRLRDPKSNTVIPTGSVLAQRTPGDMGKIAGLLHYFEDVIGKTFEQKQKPAKLVIPASLATEVSTLKTSPPRLPDQQNKQRQVLKVDRLIKIPSNTSDLFQLQKLISPKSLTASFASMFKHIVLRERLDRKMAKQTEEVSGREKTLLFLIDNEKILNYSPSTFFLSLDAAIYNSENTYKPDNLLFLATKNINPIEIAFKNLLLNKLKESIKEFTYKLRETKKRYLNTAESTETRQVLDNILKSAHENSKSDNQQEQQEWLELVYELTICYSNIHLHTFNNYNKDIPNTKILYDSRSQDFHSWKTMDALIIFFLKNNKTTAETTEKIAEILTAALDVLKQTHQKSKNQFSYLFSENRKVAYKVFQSFFTHSGINFKEPGALQKSTILLKQFLKIDFLDGDKKALKKEQESVNLKIAGAFIDNLINDDNIDFFTDHPKNEEKDRLRNYLELLIDISDCYKSIPGSTLHPRKDKLNELINKLKTMHNDEIDSQWMLDTTVSRKKNATPRSKKKR